MQKIRVTADYVKNIIVGSGTEFIECHKCSLCESPVGYNIRHEQVYWAGSCGCTTGPTIQQHRTWADLADWVNMQPTDAAGDVVRKKLGLPPAAWHE